MKVKLLGENSDVFLRYATTNISSKVFIANKNILKYQNTQFINMYSAL